MHKKDNIKPHTAQYLVSSFIESKQRKKFHLQPTDIAILFVIAYYMDSNKEGVFYSVCQKELADTLRITERGLKRHLNKLCSISLLKEEKARIVSIYYLGEVLYSIGESNV